MHVLVHYAAAATDTGKMLVMLVCVREPRRRRYRPYGYMVALRPLRPARFPLSIAGHPCSFTLTVLTLTPLQLRSLKQP
jgi:hypothetical protein